MSEELLAKLKIKPIPKEKEVIEILIKQNPAIKEDITIKAKIIKRLKC